MESVHQIRYRLFNESFAEIVKSTNHMEVTTLLERNIMNLMELMNSQVSLGKYITRPIYILSTTRIPGLAVILVFKHLCL